MGRYNLLSQNKFTLFHNLPRIYETYFVLISINQCRAVGFKEDNYKESDNVPDWVCDSPIFPRTITHKRWDICTMVEKYVSVIIIQGLISLQEF